MLDLRAELASGEGQEVWPFRERVLQTCRFRRAYHRTPFGGPDRNVQDADGLSEQLYTYRKYVQEEGP